MARAARSFELSLEIDILVEQESDLDARGNPDLGVDGDSLVVVEASDPRRFASAPERYREEAGEQLRGASMPSMTPGWSVCGSADNHI